MSNLVICGFKGCGKTTFGKALAKKIGYDFIDTDYLIADDCRTFYEKVGEEAFRLAEKQAIAFLETVERAVIATGGGAILDPDNVALFKKIGKIIYIKEEKAVVKARLLQKPYPAFFLGKDIEREFEDMYSRRVSIYEAIWDITHLELSCRSRHGENLMEKLSALSSMVVLQD
ncbi:MAG: AAA family ATPase [Rhabdochlamydiaceae bacterium]